MSLGEFSLNKGRRKELQKRGPFSSQVNAYKYTK